MLVGSVAEVGGFIVELNAAFITSVKVGFSTKLDELGTAKPPPPAIPAPKRL